MKRIILFLLINISFETAYAEPLLEGTPSELTGYLRGIPSMIEVVGKANINANADNAIVTLVVKSEAEKLSAAIKANQNTRMKVTKFLESKGFQTDKITSSKFSSTPEYGFFGDKPKSYKVNNAVLLSINTEQELLYISEAVDNFPEVYLVGTRFEHTEHEEFKSMALKKAIDNALQKKDLYEQTLGANLQVAKISEITGGSPVQTEVDNSRKSLASYGGAKSANFGALIYRSTVTIKFKVVE